MGDLKPIATLLLLVAATAATANRVSHKVECTSRTMVVWVPVEEDVIGVEVDKWGFLPDCVAVRTPTHHVISLPLDDLSCGTMRIRNKLTGMTTYQSKIAVKTSYGRRVVPIKCSADPNGNIVKRDVLSLPPDFKEPDFIEITSEVTGTAPVPILGVGVRQNGQLVGGQINVRPGTPLTMEVFLDDTSANIYGILMNYMEVTDTANKRETIIFNGCSVDPVLFDNFITTSGDFVSAKFRAFKFPETNYVLFRGTVDVCLDKCQGIECSNGQLGYGRRRRGIEDETPDPNKIFEVTMMTFLKVDETFNGTKSEEKRLAEEVDNRVAEDVKEVERALEEVEEERLREAMAVEKVLQEEQDAVNPWGRPAIVIGEDRASFKSSEGEEPVYIYYNSAVTLSQSLLLVGVTALLARRV